MFKNGNYVGAIQTYQKGFVMCNEYFALMGNDLPMKCDFTGAEQENLDNDTLWLQDFELLKSQFCNNMSACYCKMGDFTSADLYNNWALKECPDYARALHRKCIILEATGEYTQAVKIAEWCVQRFNHADESQDD